MSGLVDGVIDYQAAKNSTSFMGYEWMRFKYGMMILGILAVPFVVLYVIFLLFGKSTPAKSKEQFEQRPMFRHPMSAKA